MLTFYDISDPTLFAGFERLDLSGATTATSKIIGTGWRHLVLRGVLRSTRAGQSISGMGVRFNADSGNNYQYQYIYGISTNRNAAITQAESSVVIETPAATSGAGFVATFRMDIPFYRESSFHKIGTIADGNHRTSATNNHPIFIQNWAWASTAAITSITCVESTGNTWESGSYVDIFGVA